MSIRYCPQCGAENVEDAKFCQFCRAQMGAASGAPVTQAAVQPTDQTTQMPEQQPAPAPAAATVPAPIAPPAPPVAQTVAPQGQPAQATYAQPAYTQPAQPVQSDYSKATQPYQPTPPPQKKGKGKMIAMIAGGVVLLIAIIVIIAVNVVGGVTNEVTQADYYEISGDKVPSVKTALNKTYTCTGFFTKTTSDIETQDIIYKTEGASNEEMMAYAQYLANEGWMRIRDCDWTKTSYPKSEGQGFQMARNSTESGYALAVTIYYEPGGFNIVVDRFEGSVDGATTDNTTTNPTSTTSTAQNADDLQAPVWFATFNSKQYTVGFTSHSSAQSTDGSSTADVELSAELYVDGDRQAALMEIMGTVAHYVYKDNKIYIISDSDQTVYVSAGDGTSPAPNTEGMTFVSTSEESFMGRTLYCETWKSAKGKDVKWFFDASANYMIEGFKVVNDDGSVTETYIEYLSTQVDTSVFDIPTSYQVVEQ